MPTFIDESGDTGTSPDPSNCHFRLVAVWVPTQAVAEAFRESVQQLRRQLGLRPEYEFKFSKTWPHPDRRDAFFRAALRHEFRFAGTSLDKRLPAWSSATTQAMHWATTTCLAASLRPTYLQAQQASGGSLNELVVVDDNGDRNFLAMVRDSFRGLGSASQPRLYLIGKVRFRGSGPDELLQLADMVCGAYAAHLDGTSDWFRRIEERQVGVARK